MLTLLGIEVGDLVADAIRSLVDLLIPDFAAGWAGSLVTALVAVPDVTGPGFGRLAGLRDGLTGVGVALLSLCLVAGGLQVWTAGFAQGGMRAGELVRRAVVAAGAMVVLPELLRAGVVATNLGTAALIRSPAVRDGLDAAFGEAFVFGAFTAGLSLGLAVPVAVGVAFFVVALLVMKAGLTALLAVLVLAAPIVLGLSPLPQARGLVGAWCAGLGAVLVIPVAWALVFSAGALLAADSLTLTGGPFAALAKPLAGLACFWLAFRTPGFLLAAGRTVGLHPSSVLSAVPAAIGGRGSSSRRPPDQPGASAGSRSGGRFATLAARGRSSRSPIVRSAAAALPAPRRPAPASQPKNGSGSSRTRGASSPTRPAGRPSTRPASAGRSSPASSAPAKATRTTPGSTAPPSRDTQPQAERARRVGDLTVAPRPPRSSRPPFPDSPRGVRPLPSADRRPTTPRPAGPKAATASPKPSPAQRASSPAPRSATPRPSPPASRPAAAPKRRPPTRTG